MVKWYVPFIVLIFLVFSLYMTWFAFNVADYKIEHERSECFSNKSINWTISCDNINLSPEYLFVASPWALLSLIIILLLYENLSEVKEEMFLERIGKVYNKGSKK